MARPTFVFRPHLLDDLRTYDRTKLIRDVSAGLTVGVVALPLAMAFAIASGLKPEAGIFTAIIAGFLISALGGSRVQIGGPAGAFIVVVYGIIERHGVANLLIATMLAGVLLFMMGVFRLGTLIRYVPVPIVIGFTNGIAVLIALSQVRDFFGLQIAKMPGDFFAQVRVLAAHAGTLNLAASLLGLGSLLLVFAWTRWVAGGRAATSQRGGLPALFAAIPGTVVALLAGTLMVMLFQLPVETIGSRFGGIPRALPGFALPDFSWEGVKQLFAPTLTIVLLGAIESLLCARIADSVTGERHDPNQELMGQGIANFVVPLFGGMPATGTIARTITNIRAGAASPVAGLLHAATLLAIVLVAAPLAENIPLATLAAILLFVAWNMGEWHEFVRLRRFAYSYRMVMLATFLLTVVVDLTVAVQVGLALACLFFIYRIADLTRVEPLAPADLPSDPTLGVAVYAVYGSLFFAAVGKLEDLAGAHGPLPRILILELHRLIALDATGLDALDNLRRTLERDGARLMVCSVNHQPLSLMTRSGFLERLGADNCLDTLNAALVRANALVAEAETV